MARWYLQRPGAAPLGPIDAAELQAAWKRQEIPSDSIVCAEGFSQWARFDQIAELVGAPAAAVPTPHMPPEQRHPTAPTATGSRAGMIALILGLAALVLFIGGGVAWFATNSASAKDFPFEATVKGLDADDKLPKQTHQTKAHMEKLLRLKKEADGTDAYFNTMLGLDPESGPGLAIGTRVKVVSEGRAEYKDLWISYSEVDVLSGDSNGRHVYIATSNLSGTGASTSPTVVASTSAKTGDGNACANACFFRTSHELEAKGINPNTQQGETWVKCFKECGVNP